jgi:predicted amidohydrolase YtcJ
MGCPNLTGTLGVRLAEMSHSVLLVLFVSMVVACQQDRMEFADLALVGGQVITLTSEGVVEAVAVRDGKVQATGTSSEIRKLIGPGTEVIDLRGRSVIPGLADNHFHSVGGGLGVDLAAVRSMDDLLDRIVERANELSTDGIIVTNSDWHEGQLKEQRLPLRDDLDSRISQNPVVVVRGGHEYILNSAALRHWNIKESTTSVEGGRIGRYPDGRLNGELVDLAKRLVVLPEEPPTDLEMELGKLREEHALLNKSGITSIRYPGISQSKYELLKIMRDAGLLTVRVNALLRAPGASTIADMREAISTWPTPDEGDQWVRIGGVKLGVDGGFEGGLMRDPYVEPWGEGGSFYGLQTMDRSSYLAMVQEFNRLGWRIATHAVGDAAIDLVLDVYEQVNQEIPLLGRRWAIEHAFISNEDQVLQMKNLGLVLSVQNHLYLAAPSLVNYWGKKRAEFTTPLRFYASSGVPVSLGTDSPVVPYNPWWMLHHFTTRNTISGGVMGLEQKIGREEALRFATEGYSYLTFEEDIKGTLEVGKLADFAITADSYLECLDPCLEEMLVDMTVLGGKVVWERDH